MLLLYVFSMTCHMVLVFEDLVVLILLDLFSRSNSLGYYYNPRRENKNNLKSYIASFLALLFATS